MQGLSEEAGGVHREPSDHINQQWRLLYVGYQEATWMEQQGSSDLNAVDPTMIGSGSRAKVNGRGTTGFGRQVVSPHHLPGLGGIHMQWHDPILL